ncbi:NAD(P)/FAD-dependent oxidoreductase [Jannaschia sp. Os4]|uniref:NAD(P)/FAD-dependent oxidoreductase n=1 Tax=Jannaschia sp. Os4 TaxID=2807617 RepID=UPI001939CAC6|nr:FAD/NAD(P)-binding oxidoreductase [Jannaschia sp. Os4]MBM2575812.1 NAD(P)/FAD-dependent oxidoreductase [Jannaschia sp. Os4]
MTDVPHHVAVVGAGQAAATLAETLRKRGHDGPITIYGDEPEPPYQRPPLSKGYLLGEMARERLYLRPPDWYAEHGVTLRTGCRVEAIDADARTLTHAGGTDGWDALVLATGSTPKQLPDHCGGKLRGVHIIRTLADIDRMEPDFQAGKRLLVVGGGYIGLEAAAVGRKLGLEVTVLEAANRLLSRTSCWDTAVWFADLHRSHGATIREGAKLEGLMGGGDGDDRVARAVLTDGAVIDSDVVVVGIGIVPNTALAEAAGLVLDDGIAVDQLGRTSAPGIWACGDCTSFPHGPGRVRIESVGNAIDMAEAVAGNLLGDDAAYVARPWFWSDQYDVKLQIAGLNHGFDDVVVRDGDGRSHWYYHGDRLLAVDAMNAPRAYMVGKRMIEAGRSPDKAKVADGSVPAKDLMA